MSESGYRPTSTRSILLGVLLFVIFMLAICSLSEVAKSLGSAFLFVPTQLGWIEPVNWADVTVIEMRNPPSSIHFSRTGRYAVYSIDYDLLVITDQLAEADSIEPWLKITNANTGAKTPIGYIKRGLLPFDSPAVKGRPILTFVIDEPGTYNLTMPHRPAQIGIVPDVVTGHEGLIILLFALQVLILLLPLSWILRRNWSARQARIHEVMRLKTIHGEKFWQSEAERNKKRNASRWK